MVLAEIMAMLGISNIRLRYGQLLTLPFGDNIFDGILCYGVLHIVPWREALREFRRVLKPGGRLYFTANDIGYYIHVWRNRPNATVDNDPRKPAAYALYNAYRYANGLDIEGGCGAFIDPQEILVELEESGFIEVQKGGEGCLQHPNWSGPVGPSFFQESYDGLPGVYEILATRG
jgi:ubiquinone/menaquinone biosynthesis C-methylase UbiE